jgi:hypothetical protein
MQPLVAKLESKCSRNVAFSHINIDAASNRALVQKYGVSSIPRYILLDSSGNIEQQWIGTGPASEFDPMLVYCSR